MVFRRSFTENLKKINLELFFLQCCGLQDSNFNKNVLLQEGLIKNFKENILVKVNFLNLFKRELPFGYLSQIRKLSWKFT